MAFAASGCFATGSGRAPYFGRGTKLINSKSIRLGSRVQFGDNTRLESFGPGTEPKIEIGDGTSFGDSLHVGAVSGVSIGRNVLGASGILIIDHNHGNPREDINSSKIVAPRDRPLRSRGPIVIGDSVWLGERVIVLGGSSIGEGAIIAAASIVRGHVPARRIYAGDHLTDR